MKTSEAFKSVLFSWDLWCALGLVAIMAFVIRRDVEARTAKGVFEISVTVLSIVFSVFFAGLTVLITAGDNEFVRFLEEDGAYRAIIWTFKFTLFLLFFALLFAIALFVSVLSLDDLRQYVFPKWLLLLFGFITIYSLFAAFNSSLDTIKYAEYRARFIEIMRRGMDENA